MSLKCLEKTCLIWVAVSVIFHLIPTPGSLRLCLSQPWVSFSTCLASPVIVASELVPCLWPGLLQSPRSPQRGFPTMHVCPWCSTALSPAGAPKCPEDKVRTLSLVFSESDLVATSHCVLPHFSHPPTHTTLTPNMYIPHIHTHVHSIIHHTHAHTYSCKTKLLCSSSSLKKCMILIPHLSFS